MGKAALIVGSSWPMSGTMSPSRRAVEGAGAHVVGETYSRRAEGRRRRSRRGSARRQMERMDVGVLGRVRRRRAETRLHEDLSGGRGDRSRRGDRRGAGDGTLDRPFAQSASKRSAAHDAFARGGASVHGSECVGAAFPRSPRGAFVRDPSHRRERGLSARGAPARCRRVRAHVVRGGVGSADHRRSRRTDFRCEPRLREGRGVAQAGLVGGRFADYFSEPEKAAIALRAAVSRGAATDAPLGLRHRDGTHIDVLYNFTIFRGSDGRSGGRLRLRPRSHREAEGGPRVGDSRDDGFADRTRRPPAFPRSGGTRGGAVPPLRS